MNHLYVLSYKGNEPFVYLSQECIQMILNLYDLDIQMVLTDLYDLDIQMIHDLYN
jgi:hypothetical protein